MVVERRSRSESLRTGFTILELVITVMIIGILSAVAAAKVANSLHRMRVEQAAKRIKVDLGYARQTAISQSTTLTASFMPASHAYSIAGLPDLDHPGQNYAVALNDSPYNASLVSANFDGESEIQFDRFGKPGSGGTIKVASGGYQGTVTIDPETGTASIP